MKRRSFLRDCLLGIAASLVPRLLQPVIPELVTDINIEARWLCNKFYSFVYTFYYENGQSSTLIPKSPTT